MRKTWNEKMNAVAEPKVVTIERSFLHIPPGSRMLVATPRIVRDYIEKIPAGRTKTISQMRQELAKRYKAQVTCPTSSGIFVRVSAEAALEDLKAGKPVGEITPFWRIVDPDSPAAKRISCGPEFIRERRKAETSGAR